MRNGKVFICAGDNVTLTGFPCGIEKVLNFKISFQDLKKVLNLAKYTLG